MASGGVVQVEVAPFVGKTYRMVDDPATDGVVAWGADNNSFVVADPFVFSQTLLPAHFKHANFSSFVRQLNTYGFRKVDPDRWEFAHASFLRGQTRLLRHIVRRSSAGSKRNKDDACDDDDGTVAMEVARLKQEQRAIEDRMAAMWRRVQETERRPKQMLAFLLKVAGDPQVLRRLLASSSSAPGPGAEVIKRPRLLHDGGGSAGEDAVDLAGFYAADDVFPVDSTNGY